MKHIQSENTADELLGQIVDEYLSALADGKQPDIKEYEGRYPELAQTLRVVIPAILATAGEDSGELPLARDLKEKRIGDFRILRQIGRGGMGIVYEAEQISMARKVALKVLPFAGLVDELKIRRFQNEVRAVAALDHPNIVSVFMVGNERGVHYYAMQLIRGRNLAQVVDSLREQKNEGRVLDANALTETIASGSKQPAGDSVSGTPHSVRTVAETVKDHANSTIPHDSQREYFRNVTVLGIQAANALQHAHDQGIIHRDIKPANLLIDREANLYLTDFGLARIEADAGVTMTGDLIGTLRYMAPEQALAQRVDIDHRADIYSLAATLFELLALRPAFDAEDRQKLLKQIAFEEPTSLRKINSDIPADLETIIQKAMSKDMEDRYSSSEELANDLRRFLEHRPIQAKPPTTTQRLFKWTRRNPRLVLTAIACLTIVALVLGLSTVLIAQQRNQAVTDANTIKTNLYFSELYQAFQAWGAGNAPRTRQLLAKQIPAEGSDDLRDVAWYYLASRYQANQGERLFERSSTLSVSPTRQSLCADVDGDLVLMNLKTQERKLLVKNIAKRTDWIGSSDISPDGDRVAVCTADGVRIINVASKESVFIDAPDGHLVRFSPDGKLGAHVDRDGIAYLWDAITGEVRWSKSLKQGAADARVLRFSPDGERLVVVFRGPSYVAVANVDGGTNRTIPLQQEFIYQLIFFDDESLIVPGAGTFGTIFVDLDAQAETKREGPWLPSTRYVSALDLNEDKTLIVLGTESNAVELWDLAKRQLVWRQVRGRRIDNVRFLTDRKLLIDCDGVVETTELGKSGVSELIRETRYHWHNSLCQVGDEMALAGPSHQIVYWNPATGQHRETDFGFDVEEKDRENLQVINMASSPDKSRLAFTSLWENTVRILSEKGVHRIEEGRVFAMDYSSDGKWLALGVDYGEDINRVCVVDAQTNEVHWKSPKRMPITALSFSPDGKWLAVGCGNYRSDGLVSLWRIEGDSFKLKGEFDHMEGVMVTRISHDSRWLVAGEYSGRIGIYDLKKGDIHQTISAHSMSVQGLDFSPDGTCLVSGSYNGSIKFWQVGSWEQLGEVSGINAVQGLRFYSSPEKGLGLFVGRRITSTDPAEQEVHWINTEGDWGLSP